MWFLGNITSRMSIGSNELLKQGAKVTTNIQDIMEDFYCELVLKYT